LLLSHAGTLVVKRIILTFAVAGTALVLGLTVPVAAAPRTDDTVDAASSRYDSAEVIRKIGDVSRSRDDDTTAASGRRTKIPRVNRSRTNNCSDCQPRRHYDDQEVVKKVRNVDHSRTINTVTVVPAGRRIREINRLVIQNNETRHVGVVQHNHTIVEKEIRYVRRVPITTTVNFVTHHYRVVERPAAVSIPFEPRRAFPCGPGRGYGRTHGACGPALRVRG
jgi:hypothetical protein